MVAFDHLDDMHQAFLQQNFDLPPGSVPCHIVNSSEAFVQLARQGTTCCMIPHLQIEKELASGELIDLTPGLFQRRMLYCIFLLATNPRKKLTVSANTLILIAFYGANNV